MFGLINIYQNEHKERRMRGNEHPLSDEKKSVEVIPWGGGFTTLSLLYGMFYVCV